jgi:hypothetical protein
MTNRVRLQIDVKVDVAAILNWILMAYLLLA